MSTSEQVRRLLAAGRNYVDIARQLGIPAGRAYLIATGTPVDSSDSHAWDGRVLGTQVGVLPSAQHLLGVPAGRPEAAATVLRWMRGRVDSDPQQRAAGSAARRGR